MISPHPNNQHNIPTNLAMEHPSASQQEEAAQVYLDQQQQQQQQLVAPVVAAAPQPLAAGLSPVPDSPIQVTDPTKTSSSAFILGIHNYKALNDVNLPEFVKEHQATLTFPEKLMLMLTYVDKEYGGEDGKGVEQSPISWILDGRAFVIRSRDDLVKHLLPMFFRQAKFASFTRKLYRWGFRQVSMSTDKMGGSKREMIFGHECFQRDNKPLMSRMRSVTAAGTRRAIAASQLKQQKLQQQAADNIALEPKYAIAPTATVPGTAAPTFILTQPPAVDPKGQHQQPAFMVLPPGVTLAQPAQVQQAIAAIPAAQHAGGEQATATLIHQPQQAVMPTMAPQMTNVTLQNALLVSHQQGGAPLPPSVAPMDSNAGVAPPAVAQQQSETTEAPAAAAPATVPNGYLASLAQLGINASDPAQAAQQLQAMQNASGGDANAYMRAAIDMLLRSASNAAK